METAAVAALVTALGWAILTDLTQFRIPDAVSLIVLAAFLCSAVARGRSVDSIGLHLLAGIATLTVGLLLSLVTVFGGGDTKLLAALAAWAGFEHLLALFVAVSLAGGLLTLALIMLRRVPLPPVMRHSRHFGPLLTPGGHVPYGVAIAAGGSVLLYRVWGADFFV